MSETNRHGLSRAIPADVKRAVRQACGFGCVLCGGALIEYEHVDPPFAWATEHVVSGIALLCPQCHAKVTRGFLTKQAVKDGLADPCCKRQGFSSEFFTLGNAGPPTLVIGGLTLRNCPVPLQVQGYPVFSFLASDEPNGPMRFSGVFFNADGQLSLEVEENEWMPRADNWDVELVGGAIVIRDAPRHVSLRANIANPGTVVIEVADMYVGGYRLQATSTSLHVFPPGGGCLELTGAIADNCAVGFALS